MVTCFNKLFLNILDKHAPLIEKRGKHYNQPQWMNDEVMTAISKRDKIKPKEILISLNSGEEEQI